MSLKVALVSLLLTLNTAAWPSENETSLFLITLNRYLPVRLKFVLKHFLNPFNATSLFLYPLKKSESLQSSDVFRGSGKSPMT